MPHMTIQSDLRRFGLFDARVPRFTSYPPATRFDSTVRPATYEHWLQAIPDGAAISLYVHIPFCRRLCWFCACRTQGTSSGAPLPGYVETLLAEARLIRDRLPRAIRLARLHLGGGTPTILPPELLTSLMDGLDQTFGLGALDEFSVEIDPTDCDRARLAVLAAHGMSRASLGVQDFDPQVQAAIGRKQSLEVTRQTIADLRDLGVAAINLDLLYGLPFQTLGSLSRTLDEVIGTRPGRLALYGYAHVPWASKRQVMIPTEALPSPEQRLALSDHAQSRLIDAGYRRIGIDHFALPHDGLAIAARQRRLARSFQGYTDDRTACLIGLGASSISRLPSGYAQNEASTGRYQQQLLQGQLPIARGVSLSATDRLVGHLVESLMCYHAIDLSQLEAGQDRAAAILGRVAQDFPGCVDFEGTRFAIRDWALPLTRIIAAAIGPDALSGKSFSIAV